ncbi:MAG: ABC transporter ATP-binding protein [Actinomycetota bacterium]|nr:ABC transporter ATP-binding protein [Actinomycetota bacterium]
MTPAVFTSPAVDRPGPAGSPEVLSVERLVVRYGSAVALDGVSLTIRRGEMVALIGANGAGKTTLLNTMSGIISPSSGTIRRSGTLAHVPEGRELYADLTVEDNLRLGAWRLRSRDVTPIYDVFPKLADLSRRKAGYLSGGEQQMVAIGRALMARPDLLAIDELSQGLGPIVVQELGRHLVKLNREDGLTVLLVEQNARLALDLCSRAYVLETGRVVEEGPSARLRTEPGVRRAYLGGHPTP